MSTSRARGARLRRAALILLPLALAGCEYVGVRPPGEGGAVAQDVYDIKSMVRQMADEDKSTKRMMEHRLGALEEKVQSRNELLNANLTEIEKRIQAQNDELAALRREVAQMTFQIETISTMLNIQKPEMSPETAGLLQTREEGEPVFEDAHRQFNLGRYDDAGKGFEQALSLGLPGDKAIEARYWLAESLFRKPDLKGAYEQYTNLITSNPSHALAWRSLERLAEINEQQGREDDALRLYDQIMTTNPGYEGIDRVRQRVRELRGA
jgi:TolA-binding protein